MKGLAMATQVFPHTPEVYQEMFPIVEFQGHDPRHIECLEKIGEILVYHGKNNKFGVVFLHQHFIPNPDELFFQEGLLDREGLLLHLVDRETVLNSGSLPSTFSFAYKEEAHENDLAFYGLEYSPYSKELSDLQFSPEDEVMLREVRKLLITYGCQNIFGITLKSRDYENFGNVSLIEKTGPGPRELTTTPGDLNIQSGDYLVETLWFWECNGDGKVARSCRGACVTFTGPIGHHQG